MMNNNELVIRGMKATTRFLTVLGYDVICSDAMPPAQIVARDEDTLVFVSVSISYDAYEDETNVSREMMEEAAIAYLSAHAEDIPENTPVRFDIIAIRMATENRALLRHHVNALGTF